MTTQVTVGTLCMSDNTEIPLGPTTATDATTTEMQSDPAFTVTAQSVGDYAPGKTITGAIITAKTHCGYAYILRQGLVAALLPIGSRTAGGTGANPLNLCKPFTLQPGDKVLVFTQA
jgi:hypothetical protein